MEPRCKGPRSPMRRQLAPGHRPSSLSIAPAMARSSLCGRSRPGPVRPSISMLSRRCSIRSWILHSSRPSILSAKQCRHPPFSLRRHTGHHALWLDLTMPCASSLAGETWTVTTSPFRMIYSSRNPSAMLTVSKKTAGGRRDDDRARRDLGGQPGCARTSRTATSPWWTRIRWGRRRNDDRARRLTPGGVSPPRHLRDETVTRDSRDGRGVTNGRFRSAAGGTASQ